MNDNRSFLAQMSPFIKSPSTAVFRIFSKRGSPASKLEPRFREVHTTMNIIASIRALG